MRVADRINGWLRRVPVWPLYFVALVPAAHDVWLAFGNRLGADPVKELEHRLGLAALQLLVAALSVTPLREATGVTLLRFRRMIGLSAFFYALLHFAVWLVLDRQLAWSEVLAGPDQAALRHRRLHRAAAAGAAGGDLAGTARCGGWAARPGGGCTGSPIRRRCSPPCISSGWSRPGRWSRCSTSAAVLAPARLAAGAAPAPGRGRGRRPG